MGIDGASRRSDDLIARLGLEVLPGESGWWTAIARSSVTVTSNGGQLPASNTIYYLLSPDRPVNLWHWLEGDDIQVLVEGGPVEYVIVPTAGLPQRHVLGRLDDGRAPVVIAPGGSWKGLRLLEPDSYALMVSTVTPAWAPDRVRIGMPDEVVEQSIGLTPWLTRDVLEAFCDTSGRSSPTT
ncbi:MAG TPA: cupin domain-containing protein [Acidimicrobiales bacterium]|nr:cupin domain-containing protein [Acidimicrobiales bacterium]